MSACFRPASLVIAIWCATQATQLTSIRADETPTPQPGPVLHAPPPAPPALVRTPAPERPSPRPQGPTRYSIGEPTDEEQLYLEYINRSRANPPAEGVRLANTSDPDVLSAYSFFSVDLGLMQSQFNAISPVPPLAMNAQLLAAARLHSGDMFTNQFQGHDGSDGSTIGQRVTAQGYNWSSVAENVYSYADAVVQGHAGFNVDWGNTPGAVGGMQNPPGHRNNIHSASSREVGIGVVNGVNGSVGPQLVTQDFGAPQSATPLISGVVYYDFNGNSFYDLGEGIGGVTVDVSGSSYHAVTANSGGYAVPIPGNGNFTATFTGPGVTTHQQQVSISNLRNVKVDYLPVYSPPIVSGPDPAGINQNNTYTFTPVGAATSYQWEQTRVAPFTAVEGAENGLTDFTTDTSAGYNVIVSSPRASGSFAFHLAHPNPPTDQVLAYTRVLFPGAASQLQFNSRLATATPNQVARVQVSADQGASWEEVYSQPGADQPGEGSFRIRQVSLSNFAGRSINVRFIYDYTDGTFYPQTSSGVGWYIDDISFSDTAELTDSAVANIPTGTSFVFSPVSAANYLLRVRANTPGRTLAFGPAKGVTATSVTSPTVQFSGTPSVSGNQVQIDFNVTNYRAGMTFQLFSASDPGAAWTPDGSASFQTVVPNSQFRVTTSTGGASKMFYRVQSN
jgi:hypothetical protein